MPQLSFTAGWNRQPVISRSLLGDDLEREQFEREISRKHTQKWGTPPVIV